MAQKIFVSGQNAFAFLLTGVGWSLVDTAAHRGSGTGQSPEANVALSKWLFTRWKPEINLSDLGPSRVPGEIPSPCLDGKQMTSSDAELNLCVQCNIQK